MDMTSYATNHAITSDIQYSNEQYERLKDNLCKERYFKDSVHTLVTWLKNGKCNRGKEISQNFYTLIRKIGATACNSMHTLLDKTFSQHGKLLAYRVPLEVKEALKMYEIVKWKNVWRCFSKRQKLTIEHHIRNIKAMKAFYETIGEDHVVTDMIISDGEDGTENSASFLEKFNILVEDLEENLFRLDAATANKSNFQTEQYSLDDMCSKCQEIQDKFVIMQSELDELRKFKQGYQSRNSLPCDSKEKDLELEKNTAYLTRDQSLPINDVTGTASRGRTIDERDWDERRYRPY